LQTKKKTRTGTGGSAAAMEPCGSELVLTRGPSVSKAESKLVVGWKEI